MSGHLAALRKAHDDYQVLCDMQPGKWPELQPVAVKHATKQYDADQACFDRVSKELREKDQHGWARFQSEVDWTGNTKTLDFATAGKPLFAEWTVGAQTSCRLRSDPENLGEVCVWTYTESDLWPPDNLQNDETAYLRETTTVLGRRIRSNGAKLVYHVYWAAPGDGDAYALRRMFDRFAGFQSKGGKK